MKGLLLAAGLAAALVAPAFAVDRTINPANWRSCAVGPLGDIGGDADWNAVPRWTRDPAISRWFYNEPRLLALHGLCNEKFHRVVLCLPGWDMSGPQKDPWYLVCSAVFGD
jgi:hypothetical protein